MRYVYAQILLPIAKTTIFQRVYPPYASAPHKSAISTVDRQGVTGALMNISYNQRNKPLVPNIHKIKVYKACNIKPDSCNYNPIASPFK